MGENGFLGKNTGIPGFSRFVGGKGSQGKSKSAKIQDSRGKLRQGHYKPLETGCRWAKLAL